MTAHLKSVPAPKPKPTKDIYAADKALAATIDWAAVHIAADRRGPFDWIGRRR